MIGDHIEIAVVEIKGDQIKLGIKAPRNVKVYRHEVYDAIQQENIAASKSSPDIIPTLNGMFEKNSKKNDKNTSENANTDISSGKKE